MLGCLSRACGRILQKLNGDDATTPTTTPNLHQLHTKWYRSIKAYELAENGETLKNRAICTCENLWEHAI